MAPPVGSPRTLPVPVVLGRRGGGRGGGLPTGQQDLAKIWSDGLWKWPSLWRCMRRNVVWVGPLWLWLMARYHQIGSGINARVRTSGFRNGYIYHGRPESVLIAAAIFRKNEVNWAHWSMLTARCTGARSPTPPPPPPPSPGALLPESFVLSSGELTAWRIKPTSRVAMVSGPCSPPPPRTVGNRWGWGGVGGWPWQGLLMGHVTLGPCGMGD